MISQPCTCVTFIEECDSVVWNHESKGKYLVQSRYVVVSLRGFTPVYTPATWDIKIPNRICLAAHKSTLIQFHLNPSQTTWIDVDLCAAKQAHRVQITPVCNNFLTRDNLSTRRRAEDSTCLFCCEHKIVHHLFFSCCLTIRMCGIVPEFLGLNIGTDLCKTLAAKKKHALNNIY